MTQYFVEHYESAYEKQQKATIGQTVGSESPAYIIEAICVSGLIIAVGYRFIGGVDTSEFIPKMSAFAIAAFRILPSLGRISSSFNLFVANCPALNAVHENLREVIQFEEKSEKQIDNSTLSSEKQCEFIDKVKVDHVHWHYPNTDKNVLNGLNIEIKKGTSVAFIGQSGAGKTTLADVILGLLIPQSGHVLVDGVNIRTIPELWSKIIGYVPQSVYLTDETIRGNVAFGIEEDEIDDERVWNALEQAQISQFIRDLPNGIYTYVGERGVRFSGGQRQRIAIARALYCNPDILVLDEATSSLDNETEEAVMEAIDALHGQKTLIIVAHRLSTIRNCDFIYEVSENQIRLCDKRELFE